jgi:hypothetical protein
MILPYLIYTRVGDLTIIDVGDKLLREPPDDQAKDFRLVAFDRAAKPQRNPYDSDLPENSVRIINNRC